MTATAYSNSTPSPAEMRFVKGLTMPPSRCYTSFFIKVSVCWAAYRAAPTHNTKRRNKFATWVYAKVETTHWWLSQPLGKKWIR